MSGRWAARNPRSTSSTYGTGSRTSPGGTRPATTRPPSSPRTWWRAPGSGTSRRTTGSPGTTSTCNHSSTRRGASPAALPPLGQVRALRAESGIVSVPGVEHARVVEFVENFRFDVVNEGGERVLIAERVADPAGEQRIAGEDVRGHALGFVHQGDGARRVAGQADDTEAGRPHGDDIAVVHLEVDLHSGLVRDLLGVGRAGDGHRGGFVHDRRERAMVVPEIGRASCRERGEVMVMVVSLKRTSVCIWHETIEYD